MILLISFFTLLLQTSAVACQASGVTFADEAIVDTLLTYPNRYLLVEATDLYERLESQPVFLIDAREEAGDSLIPGAVHFSAISKLTDPDNPVASYLIGPELFGKMICEIGLTDSDNVMIYDSAHSLASARLFYALDYYGFSNATILNGGFAGVDERAAYSGHIPNAVNLVWRKVLEPEGIPYFLPASAIQQQYDALGITCDKEVIPHCHTNVRGSHAYFTLRLMGYDSVRAYEGS